jgi:hypothetical protein
VTMSQDNERCYRSNNRVRRVRELFVPSLQLSCKSQTSLTFFLKWVFFVVVVVLNLESSTQTEQQERPRGVRTRTMAERLGSYLQDKDLSQIFSAIPCALEINF